LASSARAIRWSQDLVATRINHRVKDYIEMVNKGSTTARAAGGLLGIVASAMPEYSCHNPSAPAWSAG